MITTDEVKLIKAKAEILKEFPNANWLVTGRYGGVFVLCKHPDTPMIEPGVNWKMSNRNSCDDAEWKDVDHIAHGYFTGAWQCSLIKIQ